tara:strand:+ start:2062 stop:2238 length:177 start_codon:yes stop_codon:yes gene_type:complete
MITDEEDETMNECKHEWRLEVSHGEWFGYGIDAEQYTDVWYECKKCEAEKEYMEDDEQ